MHRSPNVRTLGCSHSSRFHSRFLTPLGARSHTFLCSDAESIESEETEPSSSSPRSRRREKDDKEKTRDSLFIFDRDDFGDGLLDDSGFFDEGTPNY